jgi:hypothetical protein
VIWAGTVRNYQELQFYDINCLIMWTGGGYLGDLYHVNEIMRSLDKKAAAIYYYRITANRKKFPCPTLWIVFQLSRRMPLVYTKIT